MRPQRLREGIKRARRILRIHRMGWWAARVWPEWYADGGEEEHKLRFTRCPCSCDACGNPRRHWGTLTIQERKANSEMHDQMRDLDDWDWQAWRDWYADYHYLNLISQEAQYGNLDS